MANGEKQGASSVSDWSGKQNHVPGSSDLALRNAIARINNDRHPVRNWIDADGLAVIYETAEFKIRMSFVMARLGKRGGGETQASNQGRNQYKAGLLHRGAPCGLDWRAELLAVQLQREWKSHAAAQQLDNYQLRTKQLGG
jgi:hypothetical protein